MSQEPPDLEPSPGPPARLAIGLIRVYQKGISPLKRAFFPAAGCRFYPTCSAYAAEVYLRHGFLRGSALTARRLLKCGPWHPGGIDEAPPRNR